MSYTHILAPTDFSPLANHALTYAFQEAELHNAKLTLLHALHHQPDEVYYIKGQPTDPSASSSLNFGVESFQFHTGVFDAKLPIDSALFVVRLVRPGCNCSLQYGQFADAVVAQTLAR